LRRLFYFSNLVILGTLACLVVATVSAALAALLSCRVRCPYCIFHLLMANKMMITTLYDRFTYATCLLNVDWLTAPVVAGVVDELFDAGAR